MTLSLVVLIVSVLVGVRSEVHRGSYETPEGDVLTYLIDNSQNSANLLVFSDEVELVNATYDKTADKITFHILGQDHLDSTEEDFVEEAALTAELMDTCFGRYLPAFSQHVFDTHGVYGHENEAMMLLYQLGMFSNQYHAPTGNRSKRSWMPFLSSSPKHLEEADLESVFDKEVVDICEKKLPSKHGGCSANLAVEGSKNICKLRTDYEAKNARQFSVEEVALGCWGLCGPWCQCWDHVCGDCCYHPGCFKHDEYCGSDPHSKECRFGKGVVYGTHGLHAC